MPPDSLARADICAARMSSVLTSPPSSRSASSSGTKDCLQPRGGVAGLRAVGLVGDDGEAFALGGGQLAHLFDGEGEGLDGADDDLLVARQRLGQLAALAAFLLGDVRHHAGGALEIKQGILKLRIDDVAVRHHQHAVEDLLVARVVQLGEEMRGPRDGVGLARAGRVLDQVLAARPVGKHRRLQLAGHVQLVKAGKDDFSICFFLSRTEMT
jgi:hypothetical protein